VKEIPVNTPSLNSFITHYEYEIKLIDMCSGEVIFPLSDLTELPAERVTEKDGRKITKIINTRPFIDEIRWLTKDTIFLRLKSIDRECCRPSDVLKALFNISHLHPGVRIKRVGLYGRTGGVTVSPDGLSYEMENLCLQKL